MKSKFKDVCDCKHDMMKWFFKCTQVVYFDFSIQSVSIPSSSLKAEERKKKNKNKKKMCI